MLSRGDSGTVSRGRVAPVHGLRDLTEGHLSPQEEQELYRYYGVEFGAGTGRTDMGRTSLQDTETGRTDTIETTTAATETTGRGPVGRDVSGPTTDEATTRSEERLNVGTRAEEVGRARLHKYVVTDNVTETVPVSREEVRVEREPITDANVGDAMSGPEISEAEHEVVLHEEQAVAAKQTVPKERIRLEKDIVTDEEEVGGELRKERVAVEGDVPEGRGQR